MVAATAASQRQFLDALAKEPEIDWGKVEVFHLDEYIGLPISHPGSFRKMLMEQLIEKTGIENYHLLEGDAADLGGVIRDVGRALASAPWMLPSWGSAKMAILPSMTHPRISKPKSPT